MLGPTASSLLSHQQVLLATQYWNLTGQHRHLTALWLDCSLLLSLVCWLSSWILKLWNPDPRSTYVALMASQPSSSNTRLPSPMPNEEPLQLPCRAPHHLQHRVVSMGTHTHYNHSLNILNRPVQELDKTHVLEVISTGMNMIFKSF